MIWTEGEVAAFIGMGMGMDEENTCVWIAIDLYLPHPINPNDRHWLFRMWEMAAVAHVFP